MKMKKLKDKIKKEVKRRMKMYGGKWIAIHRDTAKHILKVLKKGNKNE